VSGAGTYVRPTLSAAGVAYVNHRIYLQGTATRHTGTVYRRHRCHSTDQHLRAIIIIRSISSSSSSNSDLLVAISAYMLLLYCYQRCWSLALIRLTGPLLLRLRAPNQRRKRSRVQVLVVPLSGNNLGQVVRTSGPPSSIIWYWSKSGDAIRLGR